MLFRVYSRYVPNLTRRDGSAMDRLLKQHISLAPVSGYVMPITQEHHLGLDAQATPGFRGARIQTLQAMDRTMTFMDGVRWKASSLKLTVHVAGENTDTEQRIGRPVLMDTKTFVRLCFPTPLEPVTVEAPG